MMKREQREQQVHIHVGVFLNVFNRFISKNKTRKHSSGCAARAFGGGGSFFFFFPTSFLA
jgi:hypothetical protein